MFIKIYIPESYSSGYGGDERICILTYMPGNSMSWSLRTTALGKYRSQISPQLCCRAMHWYSVDIIIWNLASVGISWDLFCFGKLQDKLSFFLMKKLLKNYLSKKKIEVFVKFLFLIWHYCLLSHNNFFIVSVWIYVPFYSDKLPIGLHSWKSAVLKF